MRFLHLADLHLGKRLGEYDLLADQSHLLGQVKALCRKCQVDALLLAGDIYDKTIPPVSAIELLDEFLTSLISDGIAIFLISGNHDSGERLHFGSRLFQEKGLYITSEFKGSLSKVTLEDDFGPVQIWSMPFLRLGTIRHYFPETANCSYDQAVGTVLAHAPVKTQERNIILAHQFVTSSGRSPALAGSESPDIAVGTIDGVEASHFQDFDYVALGHIHRSQSVGRETVRYPGSPMKYSLSEVLGEKSVLLVTLEEKGVVTVEKHPLVPLRDLRHVTGPIAKLLDPANVANPMDFMWVTLTDEAPILDAIGQVKGVYPHTLKLDYDNQMTRISARTSPFGQVRQKPLEDLFSDFYQSVTGTPPTQEEWMLFRDCLENEENSQ